MGIEYRIGTEYGRASNSGKKDSLGLFVELFMERPVYRGLEEANERLRVRVGYDLTLLSTPTACGSQGLDDS